MPADLILLQPLFRGHQSSFDREEILTHDLSGPEVQHKTAVEPVFLACKRVSPEAGHLSLMQIATAVVQALGDESVVNAVYTTNDDRLVDKSVNEC